MLCRNGCVAVSLKISFSVVGWAFFEVDLSVFGTWVASLIDRSMLALIDAEEALNN